MSIFFQDIRYALQGLLRQKGFAVVTILTLALGIGANAAIFSLLNPLLFRPLSVPDADRLCRVFSGRTGGNNYGRMSYLNYTDLPVTDVRTMNEHLGFALYPARISALLFTISGTLGLLLAMMGVYGLLAFIVRQRTREIGIRIALGAGSRDVAWSIARKVLVLLAPGLALGLLAAYAATGMMTSLLYGLDARDPLTFAAAPLVLLLTAIVATAVPTSQATRVDPVVALRVE
jgi:hypothetical protein